MIEHEIVRPAMARVAKPTHGYILEYDSKRMIASVQARDPNSGDYVFYRKVPVETPPRGFHPVEPEPGDRVVLEFIAGDPTHPVIGAFFDDDYDRRQGPYEKLVNKHAVRVPDLLSYL